MTSGDSCVPIRRSTVQELPLVSEDVSDAPAGFAKEQLKSFIERIERLEEEKKAISDDIKDVFAEAKSNGFDVKAMRQILKLRKMKSSERTEAEYMLELYKRALGMDSALDDEEADAA